MKDNKYEDFNVYILFIISDLMASYRTVVHMMRFWKETAGVVVNCSCSCLCLYILIYNTVQNMSRSLPKLILSRCSGKFTCAPHHVSECL